MVACDLILILSRAFADTMEKCTGQPLKKDIKNAAHQYRQIAGNVHQRIKLLVPQYDVVKSFRVSVIKEKLIEIIDEFKSFSGEVTGQTRLAVVQ